MCILDELKKLSIGLENFNKIRKNKYYYVDKTKLIEHIMDKSVEISLFTRPRRFGKSLNMSMLRYFFEIGTDPMFDEYFGFTDAEVKNMLHYYGQDAHYETAREWYDGYRFGNVDVYCPWDVLNYYQ